jgi:hypothetical protein
MPSGVSNAAELSCMEGLQLQHGGQCTPQCSSGYRATESALFCRFGDLHPASFSCDVTDEHEVNPTDKPPLNVAADPDRRLGPGDIHYITPGHLESELPNYWPLTNNEWLKYLEIIDEKEVNFTFNTTATETTTTNTTETTNTTTSTSTSTTTTMQLDYQTTLSIASGNILKVANISGFKLYRQIIIAPGTPQEEYNVIAQFFEDTTLNQMLVLYPMAYAHVPGTIVWMPTPYSTTTTNSTTTTTRAEPCTQPTGVVNASTQVCAEYTNTTAMIPFEGVCTPQCIVGKVPDTAVLACSDGTGTLVPPTFKCVEGEKCTPPDPATIEHFERLSNLFIQ